jgi:hypothetical protein
MNRDDVIKMAREAGVLSGYESELFQRFADLIAAHEREQCAKLMDDMAARDKLTNYYKVAALAIRERKE